MSVRMFFEIYLKLLAPIAVLDRFPESKIKSIRSSIPRPSGFSALRALFESRSGKRGKGTVRILLEIRFKLPWGPVLDTLPKSEFQRDRALRR